MALIFGFFSFSPDFQKVLTACLDEVFAIFDHHAFVKTLLPNNESMVSSIREITSAEAASMEEGKKVILANLLPTISRQAHLVIAGNEYLNVSQLSICAIREFYLQCVNLGICVYQRTPSIFSINLHSIW